MAQQERGKLGLTRSVRKTRGREHAHDSKNEAGFTCLIRQITTRFERPGSQRSNRKSAKKAIDGGEDAEDDDDEVQQAGCDGGIFDGGVEEHRGEER